MTTPLEYVRFLHKLKLPTYQTEVEALSIWRDAARDAQHPENDRPAWIIELTATAVSIEIAPHVKERLGGNGEKDHVIHVPLANVAWYRHRDKPPKKA